MNIVKWDPFRDLSTIQDRVNRLFEDTLTKFKGGEVERFASGWEPAVDVYETNNEIVMKVELPGLQKDNVSIELKDNILTIKGERKFEEEVKKEDYHRIERSYGYFQRSFSLPSTIQQDKVKANFKDGILDIKLPKAEKAKPTQIEIES